jgi:helix-turn-helix protein
MEDSEMDQITLVLPQMLSEKQAARILSVSIAALRRWRREGRGPEFARLERCVRYNVKSIEGWLEENTSGNKKGADSLLPAKTEVRDGHSIPSH